MLMANHGSRRASHDMPALSASPGDHVVCAVTRSQIPPRSSLLERRRQEAYETAELGGEAEVMSAAPLLGRASARPGPGRSTGSPRRPATRPDRPGRQPEQGSLVSGTAPPERSSLS